MTPVTDNPIIVPDRELKKRRSPVSLNRRAYGALSAVGRRAKNTNGSVLVGTSGTPLTPEASVQPVCTSGLKRSAFHAADGRRIPSGMPIPEDDDLSNGVVKRC